MSQQWVDLATTVLTTVGILCGTGGAATLIIKRRPSRTTSLAEEVALLRQRVTDAETAAASAKTELAEVRRDLRGVTDYVHDLREHIALEKPPPPPDWPEGLRL